jgi:LPS export ABC transporter protein LptC
MISRSKKYHLNNIIARILLPGILFLTIGACKNDPNEIRALTGSGKKQPDRAEDVTIIYSKNGKIEMRLFAHDFERNEYAKPPYIDMNNAIKAEFYNDSGVIQNVLTADSSRYYEQQGNVLVWDSVKIVGIKGTLTTSELIWNESIQKFFTEKAVKITTPAETLYGDGMEANRDFSWYRILHPRGTVQVNKGEVPQ